MARNKKIKVEDQEISIILDGGKEYLPLNSQINYCG